MATVSMGISPDDFVQQVYYMQEKVLLDFWPSDDNYREVLVEANLVLSELESVQEWSWLRDTITLGKASSELILPPDVQKISTLFHDCVMLYRGKEVDGEVILEDFPAVQAPIASGGSKNYFRQRQSGVFGAKDRDFELKAIVQGNKIIWNRPLTDFEKNLYVVVDVQKHITPFHVCKPGDCISENSEYACPDSKDIYLDDMPEPTYVIIMTAARHAEGSPPAMARVAGLQDAAQRILSQMRSNDTTATDADYIEWDDFSYVEVV